jgi:hypothetical protein
MPQFLELHHSPTPPHTAAPGAQPIGIVTIQPIMALAPAPPISAFDPYRMCFSVNVYLDNADITQKILPILFEIAGSQSGFRSFSKIAIWKKRRQQIMHRKEIRTQLSWPKCFAIASRLRQVSTSGDRVVVFMRHAY